MGADMKTAEKGTVMKLVIDRQKWLRGEGTNLSKLLRTSDEKMCCVGFYCLSIGVPVEAIRDRLWPNDSSVSPSWRAVPSWLTSEEVELTQSLAWMNDEPEIPEAERESKIAAVFQNHGVEVEFIN